MSKTVLITGGLGFIGTNIIRQLLLSTDYSFLILDKKITKNSLQHLSDEKKLQRRIKIVEGDIRKRKILTPLIKHSDIIIHLAADTHTSGSIIHPSKTLSVNVMGTSLIFEEALKYSIEKCIVFSSSEVYGDQKVGMLMDESHQLNPITPYAASKLAADRLAYSFFLTKQLPVVIVRPFNVYGPFQTVNKMIPCFITRVMNNKAIVLNHRGTPVRDWIYVTDIANAVEKILESSNDKVQGEVFNLGTGIPSSIKEVAYLIVDKLGKERSLIQLAQTSQTETLRNVGMSKKAKNILNWKTKVLLPDGIKKTIVWYTQNRYWWENEKRS